METVKITTKQVVESEREIKIPGFYKIHGNEIKVISQDKALRVYANDISICTPSIWLESEAEESTEEAFKAKFDEVLTSFTNMKNL